MTQTQELSDSSVSKEKKTLPHLWKPGFCPNPNGRPKGSKNKLAENFITALQRDFAANGEEAIRTVRETRPSDYLRVIASVVPKEFTFREEGSTRQATDDELFEKLNAIRHSLLEGIGISHPEGDQPSPSKEATDLEPL